MCQIHENYLTKKEEDKFPWSNSAWNKIKLHYKKKKEKKKWKRRAWPGSHCWKNSWTSATTQESKEESYSISRIYKSSQILREKLPVVRALSMPALRPLKSLKTSSTVRGLYGAPTSMASTQFNETEAEKVWNKKKRGGKDWKIFDLWASLRERESVCGRHREMGADLNRNEWTN